MLTNLRELLEKINIPDSKIKEISCKPHIVRRISQINDKSPTFTKLHYSLACTANKNIDLTKICQLIDTGLITHESMLRGVCTYPGNTHDGPIEDFIKSKDFSYTEIENAINSKLPITKRDLLREMKKEMPYADSKIIMKLANEKCTADDTNAASSMAILVDEKYKWLEEGEISLINKPSDNVLNDEKTLNDHLKRTGGKVITRFPPEPNGQLHIGHAKAINLSFLYAEKFGGITYLRFDDTNPKNEKEEHYKAIMEDIEWLGYKPHKITASSDYNDKMNEFTYKLIKDGNAYCCHCTLDDIRNRRQVFQKERDGGNFDPTILSPYRNRSMEENLKVFDKMLAGVYKDGEAVMRFKMDLGSKNPLMLDLVGSRVIDTIHPGKKRNWLVYPTYEFALCVSDSLEDVTHSFCSREFKTRQEPYHWLLKKLGLYEPVQWEFSRLNLSNTVLSKRKMGAIVRDHGFEWDDPRFYTIAGMRRRGFPSAAVNKFVRSAGITYSEAIVDVRALESFVRNELKSTSDRIFCIRNPIKLNITNLSKTTVKLVDVTKNEGEAEFSVLVNKEVYIDGSDFSENPDADFHRLTPNQIVGLIGLGAVKFLSKNDNTITCELCQDKSEPLKYIQWVADLNNKISLRLYKPLFNSFNPEQGGYINDLNLDSLEIVDGFCDGRILKAKPLDRFQFIRMGFFCCDKISTDNSPVFNLTIPLRNLY